MGEWPARLPGPRERRLPGQQGGGARLGPQGRRRRSSARPSPRRRTSSCRSSRPISPAGSMARRTSSSTAASPPSRRRSRSPGPMRNGSDTSAFEATAVAAGSPTLRSGTAVSIANVDSNFAGKWVIPGLAPRQVHGLYRTTLKFAGRQDRSLHGLLSGDDGGRDRLYGVVPRDRHQRQHDPHQHGRVKVRFPLARATHESPTGRGSRARLRPELRVGVPAGRQRRGAGRRSRTGTSTGRTSSAALYNGVDTTRRTASASTTAPS